MRYNSFQKFFAIFLVCVMLILVLPAEAIAASVQTLTAEEEQNSSDTTQVTEENAVEEVDDDYFTAERYYLDNGLVLELNQEGDSFTVVDFMNVQATSVQIPDTYLGLKVTRIGDLAFKGKTALEEVILSDNIGHIGDDVFSGCANLRYMEENGAKYIGSATNAHFYLLSAVDQSITECAVSEETKIVASYAFHNCKQLTEIVIPDSVIQVGFRALRGCDNLQSVTLPFAGETENGAVNSHVGFAFGARTYGGNISFVPTTLTRLVIKRGTLQKNALYGLDGVQHMGLPSMQQPLGYYYGGETYEDNIDYIPSALTSVEVAGGALPEKAFYNCINLENIVLGDAVTDIVTIDELFYNTKFYLNWTEGSLFSGNHLLGVKSIDDSGVYVIPEGTVGIGEKAFYDFTNLKSVVIPDSVQYIAPYAFYNCTSLADVVIPDGVTRIEEYVFYNCTSLNSIVIPDSVTSIGTYAFYKCELESITIPSSITTIEKSAFLYCSVQDVHITDLAAWCGISFADSYANPANALYLNGELITQLEITEEIERIGNYAFYQNYSLTSITIQNDSCEIGYNAFYNCTNLTGIVWGDGEITIGASAFASCTGLTEIVWGNGKTTIASKAFAGCTSLTSIVWGNGGTDIGNSAFSDCTKLTDIDWGSGEIAIGYRAFANCTSFTDVVIPDNITYIGGAVFFGCSKLEKLTVPFLGSSRESVSPLGYFFGTTSFTGTQKVRQYRYTSETSHVITYSDYYIPTSLKSVTVTDCRISYGGFYGCTGLENVTLGDGVTKIDPYAFYGCTGLKNITIPDSVTELGTYVFYGCTGLTDISLSKSITGIGEYTFYGCTGFTTFTIPEGIKTIGQYAFGNCTGLSSVTIPASVTQIDANAFSGCTGLTAVHITDMAAWCDIEFGNASANPLLYAGNLYLGDTLVTELVIPESVQYIRRYAFYGGIGLKSVTIGSSVVGIHAYSFYNCTGLEEIHFNATAIEDSYSGNYIFYSAGTDTDGITVTIGANVTRIPGYLFYPAALSGYPPKITKVVFEEGSVCQSVGTYAFYNCSGLVEIIYPNTYAQWQAMTFGGNWNASTGDYTLYCQDATVTKSGEVTYLDAAAVSGEESVLTNIATSQITQEATSTATYSEGLKYTSNGDGTCYVSGIGTCTDTDIVIPATSPAGYTVVRIGSSAFKNKTTLTSVTLPDGLTAIGDYAFYGCTKLNSVTIPDSVTSIGTYAFYKCTSLTSVTIGNGVTTINNSAFSNCTGLTSITLPGSITQMGWSVFTNCTGLTSVTISDGVTMIGNDTFSRCTKLTSVTIPDSVTKIGTSAFSGCSGLTSIVLPDGITTIAASTFSGCKNLQDITIPDSVTSIGGSAFDGCSGLTHITIPDGVTSIDDVAFRNCTVLTNIVIPDSVTSIGDSAFDGCEGFTSITIPSSVTDIGARVLAGCINLESVTVPFVGKSIKSATSTYQYPFGYFFGTSSYYANTKAVTQYYYGSSTTSTTSATYYIPMSLKSVTVTGGNILYGAFYGCSMLTSITVPDSITAIGDYAFYNCTGLTSFTIPDHVTSIGQHAFHYCKLTSITIPGEVTTIGDAAFRRCTGLTNIVIPDSVTQIGTYAFADCSGVTSVTLGKAVSSIGGNAFGQCTGLTAVHIADLNAWLRTSFGNYLANPLFYAKNLYLNGSLVTAAHFPEGTTTVPGSVFYNYPHLTEVQIPEGVTTIGNGAFYGCVGLDEVTIPQSVTDIDIYAFYGCTGIDRITIPDGVTAIRAYTFTNCTGLTDITIPSAVTSIGDQAFSGCTNLKKVIFEEGAALQEMGSQVFAGTDIGSTEGAIEYPGNALAWRFIRKATDWDGGLTTWQSSFVFGEEVTVLYEMSDDRAEFYVGEYSGTGEIANVPEVFSARPVTKIYGKSFYNAQGLKTVMIPETIHYICQNVFYNCPDLTEIVVHGSDTVMERGMIYGCEALSSLTVPSLGATVTDEETAYLGYLFGAGSYKVNENFVPMSLKKVTVTDSTFVGEHAFEDCKYLAAIILPDSVETIGSYAFSGCESLAGEWVLPAALTSIGDYAFASCNSLSEICLPDGLATIGGYAFSGCISLQEMVLPDSVTTIGVMLLDNCNNIKTVTIGSGIQEIPDVSAGNPLFGINKSLSSLTGYVVSAGNSKFACDDRGVLYELHDGLQAPVAVLDAPAKSDLKDYELPEHIVYIAPYAFAYNTTLRWIQLDRVRRIDKCAFLEATSLVAAVFGSENGVDDEAAQYAEQYEAYIADKHRPGEVYSQVIGDQAFFGCSMLQYVNLWTDFIASIGQEAFYGCDKLSSVRLSESVSSIGQNAFGKTSLESISVDENNARYADFDNVLYEKLADGSYKLLLFPSCKTAQSSDAVGKVYQTSFSLPEEIAVSIVESYAFRDAQYLKAVSLEPSVEMLVGDYAFQDASVQTVYIGQKVTSLGLVRGEGEYTVFESCESLTSIDVAEQNLYYSSEGGVLFDKAQTKLMKYPYHKMGGEYSLPDSVSVIASMAFKGNKNLTNIVVSSYVQTVGLEAFYDCSNLVTIYFDHVYAPVSVLENAFTTNTAAGGTTQALLCYSGGYYENGGKGELGWKNYQGIYPLYESNVAPSFDPEENGNLFYAMVVVDSSGVPVDGAVVSLTDPMGRTEVITAADGIAMFYDNGELFSIGFEDAYTVTVSDPSGSYYTYTNPALLLDGDMLITYITLTRLPTAYGVSCNGQDINSERLELNKSNIDFTDVLLDENGNIRYAADGQTPLFDEVVKISVIGYCDASFAFVSDNCGLYQNGVKVASVDHTEDKDGATIFHFRPQVADLANEVDIEVRLTAVSDTGEELSCSTVLNIHVFDFFVDPSQLNLEDANANIDLGAAGEFVETLLGGDGLSLSFGEHIKFTTSTEDDIVTFELEGSKELLEKKKTLINDYEKGFNENNKKGMKTYRFQYTGVFQDVNFKVSTLRYNITFTRETEGSGFYYYRCKIHNGAYGLDASDDNLIATFYGVVNRMDMAGMDSRAAAKLKADLIFITHYGYVLTEGGDEDTIKAGANNARYSEAVLQLPDKNQLVTKQKVEVSVAGSVSFQHIGNGDFRCTGGALKGNIVYQFNHDQQFTIWVIPVVLHIEAKANGELAVTIRVDENREIDWDMLLTLELDVTASLGVGCSAASVGFYGNIGSVFVLEILPDFGVNSWKIYGEMGAYAKVLWYKKTFRFTPDSWADGHYIIAPKDEVEETLLVSQMSTAASMYLADSYSSTDAQTLQSTYQPVVIDGELYKICYADVSGMESYDAYNYVKLALSKWDGEAWSEPVIIDDNGLNDAEYVLYQDGDKVMMTYTQQTQKLTESTVNDTYAAAKNLQIKVVELSENMGKPVTVSKPESYAYLTRYAVVDGVPTMVWAENADNNIFGVSPHNYIDNSGTSHVFATTANSVWTSRYIDGAWTAPKCVAENLSAVTQISLNEAGDVAYIVDTNGDLTDLTDRQLYYGPVDGEVTQFNDTAEGSVRSVIADGDRFLYYYDAVSEEQTDGWLALSASAVDFPQDAPEDFVLVYDEAGDVFAILYSKNKTWLDGEQKKTGSAIYGRFLENGAWGDAVELSAYTPANDRYVQEFTAAKIGQEIFVSASTVDAAGENGLHSSGSCQLGAVLSGEISEVDYAAGKVTFTVKNQGTVAAPVYMSVDGGEYVLISDSLISGCELQYTAILPTSVQSVCFALSAEGEGAVSVGVSLSYSDLQTNAKQVLLGENDFLLLSVRNLGNTTNAGITVIRNGAFDAAAMSGDKIYKAVTALNLQAGQVTEFTFVNEHGEIETAWAVMNLVKPGAIAYHELALSEIAEEPVVSIYTIPVSALEPSTMEENNYACLNYGACDGVLQNGEAAESNAALGSNSMEFNPTKEDELAIRFFCAEDNSVTQLCIGDLVLSADDYSVVALGVGGEIHIPAAILADMQGSHTVSVTFTSGDMCHMSLKVLGYYNVIWLDGDQILHQQSILAGTVPSFDQEMVKASDDAWVYTFAGWDCTGDGVADSVTEVTADVTYRAVWNTAPRSYTVQWSMLDDSDAVVSVTETYLYGDIPSYLGTVFAPNGMQFAGWNQEILPVTGDVVYTAMYETAKPVMIGLEIGTLPEKLTYQQGQAIDLTGMVAYKCMSDGSKKVISNNLLLVTADLWTVGTADVTVSYAGFKAVFQIAVEAVDTKLTAQSGQAAPGETVTIGINIEGNPGITSLQYQVVYDDAVMELIHVQDTGLLGGYQEPTPGIYSPYTLAWTQAGSGEGTMVLLTFLVLEETPCGTYEIDIEPLEANANGTAVSFQGTTAQVIVPPTIALKYPTLLLEDVIKMNVYFTLDQDIELSKLGMLTWTSAPSVVDISTADAVIPGAAYYSDLGYYGVTTEAIPAQNLGDTVYFCIYAELADGTYAYGKQVQYSPSTYAYNQLKGSATDAAKSLYVAILNYGAAAQTYLGYNTDALINAGLTDEMKAYVNEYSSDMVHSVSMPNATKQGTLASNGGFSAKKPSISLDGAFSINYYFTPSAEVSDEMTFYYWNAADFAAADVLSIDNATGSSTMVAENGVYSAAISGIAAKDIDGALYACGVYTDANGNTYSTGVLPYSLGFYCGNQVNSGTEKVKPLAAAIAVYGYYAAAFFS